MNVRHWLPLLGFVVPTVAIGYGVVIPRSCIAGVNEEQSGFERIAAITPPDAGLVLVTARRPRAT